MSKYLSRLFGKTIEEAMVVQAKICHVKGNCSESSYQNLFFEWKRGDTIEKSEPFGDLTNNVLEMNLAIIFNKLSIFFRRADQGQPVYQQKMSSMSLYSKSGSQKILLGEGQFELSQYAGKIREEVNLRLTGGPLLNAVITMQVSICPINQAHTVGVDTRLLLDEAPQSTAKRLNNEERKQDGTAAAAEGGMGAPAMEEQMSQIEMTINELRVTNEDLVQQNNFLTSTNVDLREQLASHKVQLRNGANGSAAGQATQDDVRLRRELSQKDELLALRDDKIAQLEAQIAAQVAEHARLSSFVESRDDGQMEGV